MAIPSCTSSSSSSSTAYAVPPPSSSQSAISAVAVAALPSPPDVAMIDPSSVEAEQLYVQAVKMGFDPEILPAKFRLAKRAAELGSPNARLLYAIMLCRGEGVEKNFPIAREILEEFAGKGNKSARWLLAEEMYLNGNGAEQNKAIQILKDLAAEGLHKAQYLLATAYYQGRGGLEKNIPEAVKLFTEAANQGHPVAQSWLGHLHQIGNGVERDFVKAKEYYIKAANQGHVQGKELLALLLHTGGPGLSADLGQAKALYEQLVLEKSPMGIRRLVILSQGEGNFPMAVEWARRGAHSGDQHCQKQLIALQLSLPDSKS